MLKSHELTVPRVVAMRLLEAAQRADGKKVCMLVTGDADAGQADGIERVDPDAVLGPIVCALSGRGRRVLATFRYPFAGNSSLEAPDALCDVYLTASLEIRGVLQLHAWRYAAEVAEEIPMRIVD